MNTEKIKILVVEDDIAIVTLMRRVLARSGYEVETAANGLKALTLITLGYIPDIVVTDFDMPEVNGLELIHELRVNHGLKMPILLVSSQVSEQRPRELVELQVETLEKPYLPEDLLKKLSSMLSKPST
jgi:CheY-like chemotaxis protein